MPRRTSKGDRRRIEILRSAAAAFRKKGYHGASVDDIAGALRMTKGSLYYHFRNKEEILYVLHDYSVDILLERLREALASGLPPEKKLRMLIEGFVHMVIDELHGTALTMDLQALGKARLRRVVAKRDRFDRGMRAIIRDGMARGVFRPGDPKLATFAILGAMNWITRWYDPAGSASSDRIAREFAELLIVGLRERGSGRRG